MSHEQLEDLVKTQLRLLQSETTHLLGGAVGRVHETVLATSGKLLRPQLVLLAAATGTPDWDQVRRAALAIELLHVGTLYHDDLVDRSPRRRGRAAVYERFGAEVAAFAGAHLLCAGNLLASSLPPSLAIAWGQAMLKVADGQLRETEQAGSLDLSAAAYMRIADLKTATLFELSAHLGGGLSGVPASALVSLRGFGRHFGIAFQLLDDLEDFLSDPVDHRAGPTDLRERIHTLPVVHGLSDSSPTSARLHHTLREDGRPLSAERITEACRLLRESGAFDSATSAVLAQAHEARRHLTTLAEGATRDALAQRLAGIETRAERCLAELAA